jgi:hypothetical protein
MATGAVSVTKCYLYRYFVCMDLLVLDTPIPYKHITDFGTFPHLILICIKLCFSLLLVITYVCRFNVW